MADIELEALRKVYEGGDEEVVAVDDISLDVRDGELLVLVGPSGSGKSTVLRAIAGLEPVTEGRVRIDGQDVTDLEPRDRNVAMVFQNFALYPTMTVRENMSFGLKMSANLTKTEREEKVDAVADLLDITELLDNKPDQLSGGEKQRVALGRAIVRDPDVFLLDEPLSNLDAKLRDSMRTEVQRIQSELGVTMVYVTHNQTEAMTMGDRIAVLREGRLQQVGTPLDCFYEPANMFVAGFIGRPEMNFIPIATGRGVGVDYDLSAALPADEPGGSLVIGARPEVLRVGSDPADEHAFPATVEVVEPLGTQTYVYFTFDAAGTDGTFVANVEGYADLDEGESLHVSIPPEEIHVFDVETGEAVRNRRNLDRDEAGVGESYP